MLCIIRIAYSFIYTVFILVQNENLVKMVYTLTDEIKSMKALFLKDSRIDPMFNQLPLSSEDALKEFEVSLADNNRLDLLVYL